MFILASISTILGATNDDAKLATPEEHDAVAPGWSTCGEFDAPSPAIFTHFNWEKTTLFDWPNSIL